MFALNLLAEEMVLSERLFWGVFTFVLGLVVVFFGMTILVLVCTAVAKVMTAKREGKKAEETVKEETPAEVVEVVDDGIPEGVRVAIMAAVIAYYEGEGAKNEFVVRKIKKLNY